MQLLVGELVRARARLPCTRHSARQTSRSVRRARRLQVGTAQAGEEREVADRSTASRRRRARRRARPRARAAGPRAPAASSPSGQRRPDRSISTSRSAPGPSALPEPAELGAERLRPRRVEQAAAPRGRNARSRRVATRQLVQVLRIRAEPRPGRGGAAPRACSSSASAERGQRRRRPLGGVRRLRSEREIERPEELRPQLAGRSRPRGGAPSSSRRSVRSSPSTSSTSSSRKRRVTRWPTSTATESSTISAPSAETPRAASAAARPARARDPGDTRRGARDLERRPRGWAGLLELGARRPARAASAATGPCRPRPGDGA